MGYDCALLDEVRYSITNRPKGVTVGYEKPTFGQIEHFFRLVGEKLVSKDDFQKFLEGCRPEEKEKEQKVTGSVSQKHPVTVGYGVSMAKMVKAGKYDWVNGNITQENFPSEGNRTAEVDTVLVHLNKVASTDEVLRHLDSLGLRPATIAELMAFGVKYPEIQREFPVIALGSVWQDSAGGRRSPGLGRGGADRRLALSWIDYVWNGVCRFLAVSK